MEFGSTGQVLFSGIAFTGTTDFDPGPGTANLTWGSMGRFTALLNPSGNLYVAGPTASSITPSATPTHATSLNYTVTFSAAVTGVDASDFTLTTTGSGTGTIGTPTSSDGGTTWVVPITGIGGDGTVRLDLLNDSTILDSSSHALSAAKTGTAATIDNTAPAISGLSLPNSAMRVGQTYTVTITVPDDNNGNYTLGSGTVAGFTLGSLTKTGANTYTATFTVTEGGGGGGGDIAAGSDIPVNIVMVDAAGNTGTAYTTAISQGADRLDTHSPTAITPTFNTLITQQANGTVVGTMTTTDLTSGGIGDTFTYALVAGNGTNDADNARFSITGNQLIASNPGTTPTGTRHINVRVTDAAGNSHTQAMTVDVVSGPTVSTANRAGAAVALVPGATTSVNYTVVFTMPVVTSTVDASDFTLTTTGSASGTIGTPTTTDGGTTWTVPISNLAGDGTIRLDLKATGTGIIDQTYSAAIPQGFTAGQTYTLDHTPPSVTAVGIPNSVHKVGDTVTATITVADDGGDTYTLAAGSTINGYALSNLTRVGSTSYTAQFTMTEGGAVRLASDTVAVDITLKDSALNTSTAYTTAISQGSDIMVGSTPSAPANWGLAQASDSGTLGDNRTNNTTPVIRGSGGTAGETIHLYDGGIQIGTALVQNDGTWSVTAPALAEGSHTLTAKQELGNVFSAASAPLSLIIDTTPPAAPVLGSLPSITDKTSFSVAGTAGGEYRHAL